MEELPINSFNSDEIGTSVREDVFCKTVEEDFTPYVGKVYESLEQAVEDYRIYGLACGFGIRKYTTRLWHDGIFQSQLIVCNREGKYKSKKKIRIGDDTGDDNGRRRSVRAIDCKARIRVLSRKGVFVIDQFIVNHNHELVSVENREFLKLTKNLNEYHKNLIVSNSRLNIGATKTYKMYKEQVNGFQNVGASLNDFKNFQRDIKCFIHERDGQIFIDHFKSMVESRPGFFFDYDLDEDGSLRRAIWADGVARRNYVAFGDAVAFDPTYSTNKYSLVFTPFTGIDNHMKSVSFCGALIAKEDFESFNWVFTRFLSAMNGKEPEYIITDQDPGIIKSVSHIFRHSRHRFCIWHIMNKVANKYGASSSDYHEFLMKLNSIVWNVEIEPTEFDRRWNEIMDEHGVGKGDWFEDCFSIRKQWVLAHCKDLRMGSIMRTTQRSESANSFFKRFEHKSGTLVEFWMRFESAMDQQRHNQKKLDNENKHSVPKLITNLKIEEHGALIYTQNIFEEFQEELKKSMTTCTCRGYREDNEYQITSVMDSTREAVYVVHYNPVTHLGKCSCTLFERRGIVCRHILWIYTGHGLSSIPSNCIARRWTKDALANTGDIIEGLELVGSEIADPKQVAVTKLWVEIHQAVGFVQGSDVKYIDDLCRIIREFRDEHQTLETLSKEQEYEQLLGCKVSSEISIKPPKQSKNKGSGRRLLSNKSKAVAVASKPKRMCKNCKQMAHHDKRNCPYPYVEKAPLAVDLVDDFCDEED